MMFVKDFLMTRGNAHDTVMLIKLYMSYIEI